MSAELVYSPGYQLPLFLGPAQLRLWRRLDRLIGGQTHARTTVRGLAIELGANPGSVSRDLDVLARLGLAVHDATWGRAGVRLWRVVARGGRRGLDAKRRRRALARMGVAAPPPGQMALSEAVPDFPVPPGTAERPTGSAVAHDAEPVPSKRDRLHSDTPDSGTVSPGGVAVPELFRTVRCACGQPRIVRVDAEPTPCPHPPRRESIWEGGR